MENIFSTLRERLFNGEVSFTYTKKNGEERNAKGTLNLAIIAEAGGYIPKGEGHTDGVQPYFDLNKNEWRSFRVSSLVSIDD